MIETETFDDITTNNDAAILDDEMLLPKCKNQRIEKAELLIIGKAVFIY